MTETRSKRLKTENKDQTNNYEFVYYNDFWFNGKEYNKIDKNLLLGSDVPVKDINLIRSLQVSQVVSVTESPVPAEHRLPDVSYYHVEVGDFPDEDIISYFDRCFQVIDEALKKDQVVYVHCGGGLSRSATIVLAYLMKKHQLSFSDAMKRVYKKRKVFPNDGFVEQLKLYESMRWVVDGFNENYRRFALKTLVYRLITRGQSFEPKNGLQKGSKINQQIQRLLCLKNEGKFVEEYWKKIEDAERNSGHSGDKGRVYRCYFCRTDLFNEINIIGRTGFGSLCANIFIEPLDTYSTQSDGPKKGYLKCPKCLIPFGAYNWLLYKPCCHLHQKHSQCLAIKVFPNKIF